MYEDAHEAYRQEHVYFPVKAEVVDANLEMIRKNPAEYFMLMAQVMRRENPHLTDCVASLGSIHRESLGEPAFLHGATFVYGILLNQALTSGGTLPIIAGKDIARYNDLIELRTPDTNNMSLIHQEFTLLQTAEPELARGILTATAYRPDGVFAQDGAAVVFGIFQTYAIAGIQ